MFRRFVGLGIDLTLVALMSFFALMLRDNFDLSADRITGVLTYTSACVATAAVLLPALGAHRSVWRLSATPDYIRLFLASLCIVMAGTLITFAHNRMEGVARSLPLIHWFLLFNGLIGARFLVRLRHERRGRPVQLANEMPATQTTNILFVGQGRLLEVCLRAVSDFSASSAKIVGVLCPAERHIGRTIVGIPVFGTPEHIADALRELEGHGVRVDRIVVASSLVRLSESVRLVLTELQKSGAIEVVYLAQSIGLEDVKANAEANAASTAREGDIGIIDRRMEFSIDAICELARGRRGYWSMKRAIDIVISAILIAALSPIFVLAALLTAIDVGRPLLFWQHRPGLGGRFMRIYKFRTMSTMFDVDGERLPDEMRVSGIGEFMRRSRLDELPQLFNVLSGSMSIIGPRPLLPSDQAPAHAARLVVRPGVSGWAQVQGGRAVSPVDKAALDVWYIANASFWLDFKIAAMTVRMVLLGECENTDAIERAWRDLYAAGICESRSGVSPTWSVDRTLDGFLPSGGPAE